MIPSPPGARNDELHHQIQKQYGEWLEPAELLELAEAQRNNFVAQRIPMEVDQVQNSAGGFVYEVDDMTRVRRFLCLGTSGGTYYVAEKELKLENAMAIVDMIGKGKGLEVVKELVEISLAGRAAKQNPTLFALAICARFPCEALAEPERAQVRIAAYEAFLKVCRIPTHVFTFVGYCEAILDKKSTGWGRSHRQAIQRWYLGQEPEHLAMQITKYQQREGWSHRDIVRLAHVDPNRAGADSAPIYDDLFLYITKGFEAMLERQQKAEGPTSGDAQPVAGEEKKGAKAPKPHKKLEGAAAAKQQEVIKFLQAVEKLKKCTDKEEAIALIREHRLVREHVPTALLNCKEVWSELLERMPMTAMLRNLAKMTAIGLLELGSEHSKKVVAALGDQGALEKARIHPFNVLLAWYTYKAGHGDRGKLKWTPIPEIIEALEKAFYATFKNVPTTGKRYLVALDVSGSMGAQIMNTSLSCRDASAAMCLLHLRNEPHVDVVAFQERLTELHLKKEYTMEQVISMISDLPFGGTDCSLPMLWAKKMQRSYDVFIVYTDNETWCGSVHPAHAMRLYRRQMGIPDAKLIVVGMTATEFTIADPKDRGMLDVAGFDSAAPEVMRNFVLGLI